MYNSNDLNFDHFKFVGKINVYISKLRKRKAANGTISKIAEDFKKIVVVIKSIELKPYAKNILPNYKKMKTTIRNWKKRPRTTYCFGCKDCSHNFRPQEVKMRNKVLREKSNCIVCRSNKSRFLKQKHNNKNNSTLY